MRIFNAEFDQLDYMFDYNADETMTLRRRNYDAVSIDDLRRIALWKLDRVLEIPETTIDELRVLAKTVSLTVESSASQAALRSLTACDGVGFPMASAFLKFVRPDVFPIIDVRAYRALTGKRIRYHQYNLDVYLAYAQDVAKIAALRGIALPSVDEQLYCFDKDHNGSISA